MQFKCFGGLLAAALPGEKASKQSPTAVCVWSNTHVFKENACEKLPITAKRRRNSCGVGKTPCFDGKRAVSGAQITAKCRKL